MINTRSIKVCLMAFLLLFTMACDNLLGGACYYEGERITRVLDANGDEYRIEPHSLTWAGILPCAVSAKATPFKSSGTSLVGYFKIPSSTKTVDVVPLLGTHKLTPIEATWE